MIQGRKRLNTMGYQLSYALHIYVSYQYARKKYDNGVKAATPVLTFN